MDKAQAKKLLRDKNLRVTAPRVAVIRVLSETSIPLSFGEVLRLLGEEDWDPATIFRNLIKLKENDIATIVSQIEGIDRYVLSDVHNQVRPHLHFFCEVCGRVLCLPAELSVKISVEGRWSESVNKATVHFRGTCPDCFK